MNRRTYLFRTLVFHGRSSVAMVLGVATAAAALTGALIVGDSMRGSLRENALARLGRVDAALVAPRFFREALTEDFAAKSTEGAGEVAAVPAVQLQAAAVHADRRTRVNRVQLLGVDERFRTLFDAHDHDETAFPAGWYDGVIVSDALARDLGARVGDDVVLRLGKPDAISTDSLLGRRDDTTATIRVTVRGIVPTQGAGAFTLFPRQSAPRTAFVPLTLLQRTLDQAARVNAIFIARNSPIDGDSPFEASNFQSRLRAVFTLADIGLSLRVDDNRRYYSLESDALFIAPVVETAARETAAALSLDISPLFAQLANSIEREPDPSSDSNAARLAIPYSTVVAMEPQGRTAGELSIEDREDTGRFASGDILLNEWAASDLESQSGDRITLRYFHLGAFGKLETRTATFSLRGVVRLDAAGSDPGFVPKYRGVTDTENLADWDPPFPLDLKKIRKKDEEYWDQYRTAPKAFVTLEDGQRLWADPAGGLGRVTALRFAPRAEGGPSTARYELRLSIERELLARIDAGRLGFNVEPVREKALRASKGNTDFGMLFIGFSFFLVASALMLVALLFRLDVERRSSELGILTATGLSPGTVRGLVLTECALRCMLGSALGCAFAPAYGWMMLAGLRSWWSAAVNAPFLSLHVVPTTLVIGFTLGTVVSLLSTALSLRGVKKRSVRSLLSGVGETVVAGGRTPRKGVASLVLLLSGFIAIAVIVLGMTSLVPEVMGFFCGGAAALTAGLAWFARTLRRPSRREISRPGLWSRILLGLRNARRHPGRSVLTAGVIASASFLLVSLEAFRLRADSSSVAAKGASQEFTFVGESTAPLTADLNTRDGRESLNVAPAEGELWSGFDAAAFRLRPGDETSCLNLYQPTKPRILGASDSMIEEGGLEFSGSLAESDKECRNPWILLRRTFSDGAVAAIGDENAVKWQLHRSLGEDFVASDEAGSQVRFRFVALLSGSPLQGEIIVAESNFRRLFPSVGGYGFFLIRAPTANVSAVESVLEKELEAYGMDLERVSDRLASYQAVQNTYLSTFQSLGGLGFLLGVGGLGAVLLRNVWERRKELALLQALGFRNSSIGVLVLSENLALLLTGLLTGTLGAVVAILPAVMTRPRELPLLPLAFVVLGALSVGLTSTIAPLVAMLRRNTIPALRSE